MTNVRSLLDTPELQEKIKALKEKSQANKVRFQRSDIKDIEVYTITISKPHFSDIDFYIIGKEDLDCALAANFEDLAGMSSLAGYIDTKKNIIEAPIMGSGIFGTIDKKKLFGPDRDEIVLSPNGKGPTIRICSESKFSYELRTSKAGELSIVIEGLSVSTDSEAENQLKKYCSEIFFKILIDINIGLRLRRRVRKGFRSRVIERVDGEKKPPGVKLEYPKFSLSFIPIALLGAASDSILPPSFQFLLNYQSIEFFLNRASRLEANQAIRSVIDAPGFSTTNEKDLSQLLGAIKIQWIVPTKKENDQLITLIKNTPLLNSVRAFLKADTAIAENVAKAHKFSDSKIEAELNDSALPARIANRIYDIRNAIVHAKEDEHGKKPLLLLQSSDEEIIDLDSALLSFIAKEIVKLYGNEGAL